MMFVTINKIKQFISINIFIQNITKVLLMHFLKRQKIVLDSIFDIFHRVWIDIFAIFVSLISWLVARLYFLYK